MNYGLLQQSNLSSAKCLIIGIIPENNFSDFIPDLDTNSTELIERLCRKLQDKGDFLWQHEVGGHDLLLIHCGKSEDYKPSTLRKTLEEIAHQLFKHQIISATICLPQLASVTPDWQLEQMLLQWDYHQYQFLDFKTDQNKNRKLKALNFFLPEACEDTLTKAEAIAQGIRFTRNLANLPANICTPTYLGEQAKLLAKEHSKISCQVFNPEEIKQLGLNMLLAVAQGSDEPACFIELQYKGKDNSAPVVLVGKGITFDSGGMTIKPGNFMDEMKYDMCGAASVLGTIKVCALLELPINVVGLIPSTENMISGKAIKPGDIITSLSGQTVEILNTDAEGRLILADALTYAERFKPQFVIDIATLTGAMVVALGNCTTGLMSTDESLSQEILKAALQSQDKVWQMPLDEEYQDALDSPIADMINGHFERTAGGITAACFLSRFTKNYRWAHLDIAGTAWVSGKKRNATGRPVPLLTQLLRNLSHES